MSIKQKNSLLLWAWSACFLLMCVSSSAQVVDAATHNLPKSGVQLVDWFTYVATVCPLIGVSGLLLWSALDQRKTLKDRVVVLESENKELRQAVINQAVAFASLATDVKATLNQAIEASKDKHDPDFSHMPKR